MGKFIVYLNDEDQENVGKNIFQAHAWESSRSHEMKRFYTLMQEFQCSLIRSAGLPCTHSSFGTAGH